MLSRKNYCSSSPWHFVYIFKRQSSAGLNENIVCLGTVTSCTGCVALLFIEVDSKGTSWTATHKKKPESALFPLEMQNLYATYNEFTIIEFALRKENVPQKKL